MELDPRIKDRKYIFDCFNADEARKYIGKNCYMTCYLERFEDVESTAKCTLGKIDDDGFFFDGESDLRFRFCLPFEFVAAKEKKLRPYTLEEFEDIFPIGEPIEFRAKEAEGVRFRLTLLGYREYSGGEDIYIGPYYYALEELFNGYEWKDPFNGDWVPFGVEVEE